jgi:protein-disulfide isomerase
MAAKAITALILGAFTLSSAECGKSSEDPTKDKPGPDVPVVQLEGVDTNPLTAREKKEWNGYVTEFISPCKSVPVPIAQCVKEKRDCAACLPAAKYLMKSVKDGLSADQVKKAYENRFDPAKIKNVPLEDSPSKGNPNAPVTIVEFADFQCPHCGEQAPHLDKFVDSRKQDVRFVFKFYVLGKFPNSENAARAAIAAGKQGKFWEMHHKIFANQQRLDQQGLDQMAKELNLDVTRLHADMQLPETQAKIAQDHKLGEDLKIEGTPSIFINGRQYDGRQELGEWVDLELQMSGGKAPPAASGSSSVPAPSGSAAPAPSGKPPAAPSSSAAPKK